MTQLTSEDRTLLSQSIAAFARDTCDYETLRRTLASDTGRRPEWWRRLAEDLGVLGIAQSESLGGLGGGPGDLAVVAEALGRHLVNEPFLQCVAIAGELLRDGGPVAESVLSAIISGQTIVAPALFERRSRYRPDAIDTTAIPIDGGWRLYGRKSVVRAAPWADALLVSALAPGGLSLFVVPIGSAGLGQIPYATFDGQRAADVVLEEVQASASALVGREGEAGAVIERAMDVGAAIQAAEAVGVMRHLLDATLEFVRQRRQFGQPIGAFQSLQHRLADMAMALERANAVTHSALSQLAAPAGVRARAVSGAKLAVDVACEVIGEGAVQLHGAIGLTEELSISHAFKRVTAIQTELGDAAFHQDRLVPLAA